MGKSENDSGISSPLGSFRVLLAYIVDVLPCLFHTLTEAIDGITKKEDTKPC